MTPHDTRDIQKSQPSPGVFRVWKMAGETLADLLIRFRKEEGFGSEVKITYAGRLDPMAEGIVIFLVGDARFEKETWNAKKKTYEVDILLGVETDTLDMLGIVTSQVVGNTVFSEKILTHTLSEMRLIASLPYPLYSSRPVDGEPLFMHARSGKSVSIPEKKIFIYNVQLLTYKEVTLSTLIDSALEVIQKVSGDFRQKAIEEGWKKLQQDFGKQKVLIVRVCISASSGTYMRSLAKWYGEKLGVPALAYKIVRTHVGK